MPQSAFQTFVGPTGATGSDGLDGLEGPPGPTGSTGPKPAGQIWLSAAGMWPSNTSGANAATLYETTTNLVDFYGLGFPDAVTSYAQANLLMPSDYNGGTVTASFVWTIGPAATAMTGAVTWGLQWNCAGNSSNIDVAFGTGQEVTQNYASAATGAFQMISSATASITASGSPAASNLADWRVYRRAAATADTQTTVAQLIGVMINYTRA